MYPGRNLYNKFRTERNLQWPTKMTSAQKLRTRGEIHKRQVNRILLCLIVRNERTVNIVTTMNRSDSMNKSS